MRENSAMIAAGNRVMTLRKYSPSAEPNASEKLGLKRRGFRAYEMV
jgi:hypothetical protein